MPGETIRTGAGGATLLTCTTRDSRGTNVLFDLPAKLELDLAGDLPAAAIKVDRTNADCSLPIDDRLIGADVDDPRIEHDLKGSWRDRLPLLSEEGRRKLITRLDPLEATLAQNPRDLVSLIGRARNLELAGLASDAAETYLTLFKSYGDAAWAARAASRLSAQILPEPDVNRAVAPALARPGLHARTSTGTPDDGPLAIRYIAPEGETYGLLIGISTYPPSVGAPNLAYSEKDAELMADFLKSPRGGKVDPSHIRIVRSAQANVADIQSALEELVRGHASPSNTLILFVAAHGTYACADDNGVPLPPGCESKYSEPFIVTRDFSQEASRTTGLPLLAFRNLLAQNAYRFGRVFAYVDVCHAGVTPWDPGKAPPPEDAIRKNFEPDQGAIGLMTASSRNRKNHELEWAYESDQLQHGIFTYFLVNGLSTAPPSVNNLVLFKDLFEDVRSRMKAAVGTLQTPDRFTTDEATLAVVNDASGKGIEIAMAAANGKVDVRRKSVDRSISPLPVLWTPRGDSGSIPGQDDFTKALAAGEVERAADLFRRMETNQIATRLEPLRNTLLRALENAGQQVILTYLQGDQVPQTREEFERGRAIFAEAVRLAPGLAKNESRRLFCQGRVAIFDKHYTEAEAALERSIRLDPNHGYAYNALGIAILEQLATHPKSLTLAVDAFRDAQKLEPSWAYPVHNLALAYAQAGDNERAIATYREAMRIAPAYSYLPYNLGLLYQRMSNPEEAERTFLLAIHRADLRAGRLGVPKDHWTERAGPLNALGTVYLAEGRRRAARTHFELALRADADYVPAMHNKAVLLAQSGHRQEAIAIWRDALKKDAHFSAARLSLAETLARERRHDEAIGEFRELLKMDDGYVAARRSLALELVAEKQSAAALDELDRLLKAEPDFPGAEAERDDIRAILEGRPPKTAAVRKALAGGRQ